MMPTPAPIKFPAAATLEKSKNIRWDNFVVQAQLNGKTGEVTYPTQLSGQMTLTDDDKVLGVGEPTIVGLVKGDGKAIQLDKKYIQFRCNKVYR